MNPENAARVQGVLCDLAAELGELGAVEKLGVDMHRGEVMVELEAEQAMKARPEEHTPHQDGRRSRDNSGMSRSMCQRIRSSPARS